MSLHYKYQGIDGRSTKEVSTNIRNTPVAEVVYKHSTSIYSYEEPIAFDANGNMFIGTKTSVIAVDPKGSFKWEFQMESSSTSYHVKSITIDSQGVIYTCRPYEGGLYAINPDGTLKWRQKWAYTTSGTTYNCSLLSPVEIDSDGYIYALIKQERLADCFVSKLDSNGNVLWSTKEPSDIFVGKVCAIDEINRIYYALTRYNLVGINIDTGGVVFDSPIYPESPTEMLSGDYVALSADGTVFVNPSDHKVHHVFGFNPNGTRRWALDTVYPYYALDMPSIVGNNCYFYTVNWDTYAEWYLNCVDATTGTLTWKSPNLLDFGISEVWNIMANKDGIVYGVGSDPNWYTITFAIDSNTNKLLWKANEFISTADKQGNLYAKYDYDIVRLINSIPSAPTKGVNISDSIGFVKI